MAEQNSGPKKRGRKRKGEAPAKPKRLPRNLESLSFEQLQDLSNTITDLMRVKKDQQIKVLKEKLALLEKL